MSVLDRDALEASPLADLHAIASELQIDGYRRLRREALIDAILARQSGEEGGEPEREEPPAKRRRTRRGGRTRAEAPAATPSGDAQDETPAEAAQDETPTEDTEAEPVAPSEEERPRRTTAEERVVEGVVELLPNGSGFVRVDPPDPSDDDVYISAAQVKRCELVSGDRVSGPRREPRRSERFASMVRIDTINDRPAEEVTDSTRFDDLPAAFPQERFKLGSDDPTVKAIEWLTPFGRGSRVTIVGGAGAGKTEALRRLGQALDAVEDLQLSVALAGVRPEEVAEWTPSPTSVVSLGASPDAQDHAVELVVDQARRIAGRGAHAVVLIDSLDGLHQHAARRVMSAARNIVDGGSLTVIATASEPVGGETTVIALDRALTIAGRFPALDLVASGTMRAELLVGEPGAEAIARARSEALD
jgi:transcription termination factor Rho